MLSVDTLSIFDYPTQQTRTNFDDYRRWLARQRRITPAVIEAILRAEGARKDFPMVCYIAGALTEATEENKLRYSKVSEIAFSRRILGYAPHLYGTDPRKHPNVTPDEVRDIDYL